MRSSCFVCACDSWADTFGSNVRGYRADSDTLLHLLATGVFHDDGSHDHVWRRAVERLVRLRDTTPGTYNEYLEKLRHLPALLATWTIGVAAVLSRREELLATALHHPEWAVPHSGHIRRGPAWFLNTNRVLSADGMHGLQPAENGGRFYYPRSNWLKDTLREPFRLIEPNDAAYREACARFEFLASMITMDTDIGFRAYPWAGEFFLDSTWGYDNNGLATTIKAELTDTWPLLAAGAFGGELPRAQNALTALAEWRGKHGRT
ncbi:hypothetical protein ACFCX0_48755 [Streptomyces sp. NPDC056352]|uniref:hypothetical protein n=1 Tax=Streptomyces sp. NPDC056352 TaxID=3345791 RepID=UPI0035E1DED5